MDTAVEPAEVAARCRRPAAAMTARVDGVGDSGLDDIPSADDHVVAAWDAASSRLAGLLDDADQAAVEIEVAVSGWMSVAAAVNLIVRRAPPPAEIAGMRAAVDSIGMEEHRRFGRCSAALVPPPGADAQTGLPAYLGMRAWQR